MITVYHATEFGNNEKPYKKVALIDTFSFQHAYRKTQNIDEAWSEDNLRSTSEGDVLVLDSIVTGKHVKKKVSIKATFL